MVYVYDLFKILKHYFLGRSLSNDKDKNDHKNLDQSIGFNNILLQNKLNQSAFTCFGTTASFMYKVEQYVTISVLVTQKFTYSVYNVRLRLTNEFNKNYNYFWKHVNNIITVTVSEIKYLFLSYKKHSKTETAD